MLNKGQGHQLILICFGGRENLPETKAPFGHRLYRCPETIQETDILGRPKRCAHYERTPGSCWQHRREPIDE